MGNICTRGPKIPALLDAKLNNELPKLLPKVMYALILDRDGNELASMKARVTHPISYKNLKSLVIAFKNTATVFGRTLQHYDSQTIHVKGQTTMYSSYPISSYSLDILLDTSTGELDDHTYSEILYTESLDNTLSSFLASLKELLEQLPR